MNKSSITQVFLRRQRRRSRGTLLAWAAAAAIFAPVWAGAVRLGWIAGSAFWALVPAAIAAYLLVRWCRRAWRTDERVLAREVDARYVLRARLESSVELSGGDSAVAVAQRTDTERKLESEKPPGTFAWLCGIGVVLIGLGAVGLEYAVLVERSHQPSLPPPAADAAPAPKAPATPPPPEPLRASIVWKSPSPKISAKATAEIPLIATAESNKGFRSISLEVAVNGAHTNSYPLAAAAIGSLAQPGASDLKLSLFLDETGAKPHDIVSYYLEAGANNNPATSPPIVSAQQFVEITPPDAPPPASLPAKINPRSQTPAGRLEQLALRQNQSNRRLEQLAPGSTELSSIAAEQAAIARDAEKLDAEHALIAPAQKSLDAAVKAAAEAARQLGLTDTQAAREPAAEAQASLQHAVDVQESEGRKAAAALLEQVRQELNDANRLQDPAAQQAQREQARRQLNAEAARQQQQGSAQAAQKLAALASQQNNPQKKSPPPAASDTKSSSASQPASAQEDSQPSDDPSSQGQGSSHDKSLPLYVAHLRPLAGATTSHASGAALIRVSANNKTARIDLTFDHLTSKEITAYLAVGGTGGKGTFVFAVGTGQITRKSWTFTPIGNFTSASLLAALKADNLYIDIDTATYSRGELGGQFHAGGGGGGGGSSGGSASGSSEGSQSGGGSQPSGGSQSGSASESGSAGGSASASISRSASGEGGDLGQESPSQPATTRSAINDVPSLNSREAEELAQLAAAVDAAAATEASLSPNAAFSQTVRQLKAAAARLSGTNDASSSLATLEMAAQEARWLTGDVRLANSAQDLARGIAGNTHHGDTFEPAARKALAERALQLANELEQAQAGAKRDEWVRRFAPEDIDPEYRKPVEDYFENLSRDSVAP